jgi:hypothetical protein
VNAPIFVEAVFATLKSLIILRDVKSTKANVISLAFVIRQSEVDSIAKAIAKKTGVCLSKERIVARLR